MIDSHCHLTAEQFVHDLDAVLSRARERGVSLFITIADTLEESSANIRLTEAEKDVLCTIGVHPHHAKDWKEDDMHTLRSLAQHEGVIGIGEIGLDYHYNFSPRDEQQKVFRQQLALAHELQLPIVIHTREAIDDTWNIVDEIKPKQLVLHCCTEQFSDIQRFLQRGYYVSFAGMATYKNADSIRQTIQQCPLEQILLETDAPFLAPQPHRGKRNEPAYIVETAKLIADVRNISLEELDRITTENTVRFFDL